MFFYIKSMPNVIFCVNILIGENMLIDTHCHLDDKKLADIQKEIIENFEKDNIEKVITSSSNIEESMIACELANNNSSIFATVGVHPHYADSLNDDVISKLKELSTNPKVVAIGEIGLDYYYNICEKNVQIKTFTDQIILADSLNLPVVFHIRDAMGDFMNIIRSYKKYFRNGGVVHSFSGSVEIAKELISYGFYLGINGICTFKNANTILDVIKEIPLKYLLLETDAPYLTPEPHRGKPNQPKYTIHMANKIAELKNLGVQEVIEETNKNAKKIFTRIKD